jgi:hypothetical protein
MTRSLVSERPPSPQTHLVAPLLCRPSCLAGRQARLASLVHLVCTYRCTLAAAAHSFSAALSFFCCAAVHADDPEFKGFDDISQLPVHRLAEIRR